MATRRTPPPVPERPFLSVAQKIGGVRELEARIQELQDFDADTVQERFKDPRVEVLETAIDETLSDMFGHRTTEYNRYDGATRLDNGPISMGGWGEDGRSDAHEARQYLREGKDRAIALLTQAKRRLETEIDREREIDARPVAIEQEKKAVTSRKIFIVHGHDEAMREAVARFLAQIGFDPIILHEQANKGRTVIEKVEDHAGSVGFAVILLSPDDEGCVKGERPQARARQNVLLELGYFIGSLGRARVCALKRGDIELPSDFGGVVFEAFDGGEWKSRLGRELEAVGYEIDWNKVMRV